MDRIIVQSKTGAIISTTSIILSKLSHALTGVWDNIEQAEGDLPNRKISGITHRSGKQIYSPQMTATESTEAILWSGESGGYPRCKGQISQNISVFLREPVMARELLQQDQIRKSNRYPWCGPVTLRHPI